MDQFPTTMDAATDSPALFRRLEWSERHLRMAASSSVMIVTTTIWTIMRIISRRIGKFRFYSEDYIYFMGQLFFYGVAGCAITLVAVGPPTGASMIIMKYRIMLPLRLCYAATLLCVKMSIILLVKRIFQQGSRFVGPLCWTALGLSVCWAIYAGLIEFLWCMPVRSAWDSTIKASQKTCIDKKAAYGAIPIIDIPIELLILLIPLQPILKLQVRTQHRVALFCMFCAGFVTIILSSLYLYYIMTDFHKSYMMCIIHAGIAQMVASSTALQPLFNKTVVRWFSVITQHSGLRKSNKSGGENSSQGLHDRRSVRNTVRLSRNTLGNHSGLRDQPPRPTESEEYLAMTSPDTWGRPKENRDAL
ncbi:hypothetical protein V2G26_007786 [Clonostachys chloroleuca]